MSKSNCETCRHKEHPDGGWCYMFEREPRGVCRQHQRRGESQPVSLIEVLLKENSLGQKNA